MSTFREELCDELMSFDVSYILLKIRAKITNRYNQVPHLTKDTL